MVSVMGGKREILGKMEIMGNKSREKREMGSEMGEKRAIWGKKMGKKGEKRPKWEKMDGIGENCSKWGEMAQNGVFFSHRGWG